MTIEQIVDIPDNHWITLELPDSIPTGVKAYVEIKIPAAETKIKTNSVITPSKEIENVRQLLQKEMHERGTTAVMTTAGEGWEAHIRERYAQP